MNSNIEFEIVKIANYICDKTNDLNSRIEIGLKGVELYETTKKIDFNFLFYVYIIYRELGSLYYQTNQNYVDSEKFFEKSLSIKKIKGDVDSVINECITKQMLCKNKLLIYLNINDNSKLIEAEALMKFIRKNDTENKLQNELFELDEIYKNILDKNLITIINFVVPTHIILNDENKINFTYKDIPCSISSKTIRNGNSLLIDGTNLFSEKDKYGIINRSLISLEIGKYINPNELVKVNKEVGDIYKPLAEAIDVYNYFVKKYIISTGKYWVPEINEKMIFNYEIKVFAGDINIKNIPLSMSVELSSSGNNSIVLDSTMMNKLIENLSVEKYKLWELAYNNAKDYYLIKNYVNSKIMINIALENFMYSFANDFLAKYKCSEELQIFLNGVTIYDDYFLKEYISEENFCKAKHDGVIKDNPPTIYKLISECYKYGELEISKTQLLKKISIIKELRNEIVHGVEVKKDLKSLAEKSITAFEEIVNILNVD